MKREVELTVAGYIVEQLWSSKLNELKSAVDAIIRQYTDYFCDDINNCCYIVLEDGTADAIVSCEYAGESDIYSIEVENNGSIVLDNGAIVSGKPLVFY